MKSRAGSDRINRIPDPEEPYLVNLVDPVWIGSRGRTPKREHLSPDDECSVSTGA
jgi:hypothetical protein